MDKKKVPQKKPDNKKRLYKNLGFAVIVALFVGVFLLSFNKPAELAQKPYNDVMNRANRGEISKLVVSGEKIEVTLNDQDKASEVTRGEAGSSIYGPGGLTNRDVSVEFKEASSSGATITALLINLLPVIIIVGVLIFLLRSAQGQGNQALGFGKSSARLYGNEKEVVKFNDVAGNDEAKVDLQEVVEFLKFPKKFQAVGARIPKGVLLVGPPGTGKTMMA